MFSQPNKKERSWKPEAARSKERKYLLQLEQVFNQATATAAVAAHMVIEDTYSTGIYLRDSEIKSLKVMIDGAAVNGMSQVLHDQKVFYVHSVGSEGGKEVLHDGEEAPRMNGKYGRDHQEPVDKVSDAVEGTTAAARNLPGAVSVVAVSESEGLMPSEDGQFYLEKLFGPPQLDGYLSLSFSPRENIMRALQLLEITPQELTVVILDRDRNRPYIEAAVRMGVNIKLIEAGDLMPALLAVADPREHDAGAHLVMGIGGFEEGIIAAAAARTQGGLAQSRRWSNDTKSFFDGILTIDDMVPGDIDRTLVSVTSITEDEWFGMPPVAVQADGSYLTQTMTISKDGYNFSWIAIEP